MADPLDIFREEGALADHAGQRSAAMRRLAPLARELHAAAGAVRTRSRA